jgi:hypothetical protein
LKWRLIRSFIEYIQNDNSIFVNLVDDSPTLVLVVDA